MTHFGVGRMNKGTVIMIAPRLLSTSTNDLVDLNKNSYEKTFLKGKSTFYSLHKNKKIYLWKQYAP